MNLQDNVVLASHKINSMNGRFASLTQAEVEACSVVDEAAICIERSQPLSDELLSELPQALETVFNC